MQGYYHWPDSVQMYSSARDMAVFLAAQLEEQPHDRLLRDAIEMTHRATVKIPDRDGDVTQAHAWERHQRALLIVDKNGGLNNVTTYIGMIPSRRIGAVILINRGELNGRDFGHPLLLRLALPNRAQP